MKSFKPFEKARSFSHPAKYKLQALIYSSSHIRYTKLSSEIENGSIYCLLQTIPFILCSSPAVMVWSREDKWGFTSIKSFSHHCSVVQAIISKTIWEDAPAHLPTYTELHCLCLSCMSPCKSWVLLRDDKNTLSSRKKALLLCILLFLAVKDAYFVQTWNFCSGCIRGHILAALLGDKNRYANPYWRFISKNMYTSFSLQEVWKSAFVQHKNPVCCGVPETEICLLMRFNHPGSNLSHLLFSTVSHQNK